MGMDYYIIPESEVNCQHEFPESLSFFFEQVGGYEEYAEVSQVSKILQIDLSVFQEISYDDGENCGEPVSAEEEDELPEDSSIIWHDTAIVIPIIDNLLAKIAAFPDYYKQVIHNPNREQDLNSLFHVTASGDEEKIKQGLEILEAKPLFGYPSDYDYLSNGELVEDLKILRKTLKCYEASGVSRFKLMYM
ncbi:MAG: hypothetical protein EOO60_06825 [Hymenobacter sp.]|nr:MAG: hypothetical protein EOO60_06825 [Hymenobacter sp.]